MRYLKIRKMLSVIVAAFLLLGLFPSSIVKVKAINEKIWFQNFEGKDADKSFITSNNVLASITDADKYDGQKSLKYQVKYSGDPSVSSGSIVLNSMDGPINTTGMEYLIMYIKDTQGSNTLKASLTDSKGFESEFNWRSVSTVKNQWIKYYIPMSDFSGIDKTSITQIRIGEWNAGTYYIDGVFFDVSLNGDLPSLVPEVPTANPVSGKYNSERKVELSTVSKNADIYYSIDGTEPNMDSSLYVSPITVNKDTTIKAFAIKQGNKSATETFKYTIDSAVPENVVASPEVNKYSNPIDITLSSSTSSSEIFYTIDGSEPTQHSTKYEKPIHIDKTTTIKALAVKNGVEGNVVTFKYQFPEVPTTPSPDVAPGKYLSNQRVRLLSDSDANIYYTLDGTTPTSASTKYTQNILIDKHTTIKALAERDGLYSNVVTLEYSIVPYSPTADKVPGTYDDSAVVELRCATDKVIIYYTLDGSTPSINSTRYTNPLLITKNQTIKAVAYDAVKDGISDVGEFNYVINKTGKLVNPTSLPASGVYSRTQKVELNTTTEGAEIYYTLDGSVPTTSSNKYTSPITVSKNTVIKSISVKDNRKSDVTISDYTIDKTPTPFLKADGKVLRKDYGSGDAVTLHGTNAGSWLVMEGWMSPTNSPDQKTTIETLTNRFGEEKAWELINLYQDNWWKEIDFDNVKKEGMNVIRLPFSYFEMLNNDGTLKESAFKRMDWFIEESSKRGLYVILDMHGAPGSQNGKDHSGDITKPDKGDLFGNEENIKKTEFLWSKIAERYRDNPWVAAYDLLNEPGGAVGTVQFELYDRLYKAVRAQDKNHVISIEAIWEPYHLPNPKIYGWENVLYQYHFYGWSNTGDSVAQSNFTDSKVPMVNELTNYNVPLLVGEFTLFNNLQSWEYALKTYEEQGWNYTTWCYKVTGSGSSWGLYTGDPEKVDIYNDTEEAIRNKWSKVGTDTSFKRNDYYADTIRAFSNPASRNTDKKINIADFESNDVTFEAGSGAIASIDKENKIGKASVKLVITGNEKPDGTKQYVSIKPSKVLDLTDDASGFPNYLVFDVYNGTGTNRSVYVTLVDKNGKMITVQTQTSTPSLKGAWSKVTLRLSDASGDIDKSQIVEIRLAMRYAGTYNFDNILVAKSFSSNVEYESRIVTNKAELTEVLEKAKNIDKTKYTEASVIALEKSVQSASVIYEDKAASQTEVNEATDLVSNAIESLKLLPDKSKLIEAINEAGKIDESKYTKESIEALIKAVKSANELLGDKNTTQEDVDNVIKSVREALSKLVLVNGNNNPDPTNPSNTNNPSNTDNTGASTDNLPKTGSEVGTSALLIMGALAIITGEALRRRNAVKR
ncbi:chitobiase/beta-hexosaminidase C-terminal domain-containing protein [Clostridium sp. 'White wine YQ']|uniref:chitobiase/beta-hexosaminidase C-terminal domain-containing protein n=1 Tax=Clostridium sp. 'White wine YQ' TaxID=3027474 RepID=UPI0023650131|nr:chitobiase/beta-hexosaminidase C-terminal domain-containing protein [Clostridium sp. 'White wine YQ']MDD7795787.1 chitobiase/beta-hexosaminidase C-terminal domain-containing protein [Clostridium sp. 'White wine YQ']